MKNKILMAILSVAIAFGLWLYVVTVVSPEFEDTYSDVRVVLRNESYLEGRNLIVTTEELPTVTLRLMGNRAELAKLNNSNISVIVDVSGILEAGEHPLEFQPSFPGDVPDNAISVQYRNPSRITITVEDKVSQPIDVEVVPKGKPELGYEEVGEAVVDHKTVNVTGPASIIGQIGKAVVEVDLEGRKETVKEELGYTLYYKDGKPVDAKLVTTDLESIHVEWTIQRTREIALDVEVLNGGGATREDLDIKILPGKVQVTGSEQLVEQLTDPYIIGQIDLSKPLSAKPYEFTLNLQNDALQVEGVTEPIKVEVSFKSKMEKTVTTTNIVVNNAPENMDPELITKSISVLIRGDKETVEALTGNDITVTVDAAGAQLNVATSVNATVSFGDKTGLTALGSYQIKLTLHESETRGAT